MRKCIYKIQHGGKFMEHEGVFHMWGSDETGVFALVETDNGSCMRLDVSHVKFTDKPVVTNNEMSGYVKEILTILKSAVNTPQ